MSIEEITKERCYIIADIGQNHQGDIHTAKDLIKAAKEAGADCVKGQKRCLEPGALFSAEELARPYSGNNAFGATYGEHRLALEFTMTQHEILRDYANGLGIEYIVSVWDLPSAKQALAAEMPWIKVPSAALTYGDLLDLLRASGVPTVLSTGMSNQAMVDDACEGWGDHWLGVMHCTSAYPCDFRDVNMNVLWYWINETNLPANAIGYSGHHNGIAVDIAAVTLGATMIERHFTLNRTQKGSDHAASLEPHGLRKLVRDIRAVEEAMGDSVKRILECEREAMRKLRTDILWGEYDCRV